MPAGESEERRLLQETRRYVEYHTRPDKSFGSVDLLKRIDALLAQPERAEEPVNAVRADEAYEEQHGRHSPAPAAPATAAPRPEWELAAGASEAAASEWAAPRTDSDGFEDTSDALAIELYGQHVDSQNIGNLEFDALHRIRDLKRELSAAIERERMERLKRVDAEHAWYKSQGRERLANEQLATAKRELTELHEEWSQDLKDAAALSRELDEAREKERLANMRADQAEEAAQSATRRSVLVEFATNYVAADKPVFEKWLNSEIEKEPYTPPVTAPGGAAAIASGSEREGE